MKASFRLTVAATLLLAGLTCAGWTADAANPIALVDKAVLALGGAEKLGHVKAAAWTATGIFTFQSVDIPVTARIVIQDTGHLRREFDINASGFQLKGVVIVAGDKAWISLNGNVENLDKEKLANERRIAYLSAIPVTVLPLKSEEFRLESIADERVGDRPAAGLKVTPPDGKEFSLYFDKESGLPVRLVAKVLDQDGKEFTDETTFGDYKPVDGIQTVTRIESKRDGQKASAVRISDFKVLDHVDAKTFAEPKPEVKNGDSIKQAKSEVKGGVRIERDISYVPDGDSSQRLDLYLPEKASDKPLPLLVWVHGGGWLGGSKSENPGAALTASGEYASASVEYRFSNKALFPAQIQDCQAAIRFLRAKAKKYNLDPDHIGAWGGSAGGHLVALLGTAGGADAFPKVGENRDQSDRVQAVIDLFGPADFAAIKRQVAADKTVKNIFNLDDMSSPYAKLFGAKPGQRAELEKSASPVTFVSKDDPPFLIIHGTADTLVPYAQSTELADALKKAGVDVVLQPVPGGGHGGPQFMSPAANRLYKNLFDKHLKGLDVQVEPLSTSELTAPQPTPSK